MSRGVARVVGLAVALVASESIVSAFHTQFAFRVDRFEVDGGRFGPADGVADFVDEFDDGLLGPNWYKAYGTVTESNGYLVVQSPGVHFPSPPDPTSATGALLDLSIAGSGSNTWVTDGGGDFTATAYWEGVVPAPDNHYHFSVYTFNPTGSGLFSEVFGLAIRNTGAAVEIEQHLTEIDQFSGTFRNTQLLFHAIEPAAVTGRLVFRIMFSDATNVATTAFSLDGGTTWQSPFPGAAIFQGRSTAQFLLSGDPLAAPLVSTTTMSTSSTTTTSTLSTTTTSTFPPECTITGCRLPTASSRGRLKVKRKGGGRSQLLSWKWNKGQATDASAFGDPLTATSYEFCLGDAAGVALMVATIPADATCGATPCWRSVASGYEFSSRAGTSGNDGIIHVVLQAGEEGAARIAVKGKGTQLALPRPPLTVPLAVRLRASNGECWGAAVTDAGVVKNKPRIFVGKTGAP